MSTKEKEVALIMQRDDLTALKLWHGREESLEHPSNGMAKSRHEVIQN
jgi:hypothetical protein